MNEKRPLTDDTREALIRHGRYVDETESDFEACLRLAGGGKEMTTERVVEILNKWKHNGFSTWKQGFNQSVYTDDDYEHGFYGFEAIAIAEKYERDGE